MLALRSESFRTKASFGLSELSPNELVTGELARFEKACGPEGLGLVEFGWEDSGQKRTIQRPSQRSRHQCTWGRFMPDGLRRFRALCVEGTQLIG